MSETPESLLNLVNASGFLFQVRVEAEIERDKNRHEWQIVDREYGWFDKTSGEEGFIDILLSKGNMRMVVECKRTLDTTWVFLVPTESQNVTRARVQWTHVGGGLKGIAGSDDLHFQPPSLESDFCVIRGQSDKDKPMLERISGLLIKSVEGLADHELEFDQSLTSVRPRIYIPVIVTTADLQVCTFDVRSVNLTDGQLPSAAFESVPFIRFRKSLASEIPPSTATDVHLFSANEYKKRTIFVVQASHLSRFMREFREVGLNIMQPQWPWDVARNRANS